ncbi:MAG: hypothetical protein AUJ74_01315 [Candidatus Omnitrophica bacterium CG1_02_44_16]|nr:MAG: hypothetical protein AUJ74_01315 [Candidatus Omnitrophica bacterium CG1_02_44_16]
MSEMQGPINPSEGDMPLVSRLLYQMIDEKYSTLLDESSDFMCITDRDGKFIYVNKKLADSLGYTKKHMLGMYMWDIVAIESRAAFSDKAKEFLKSGKTVIEGFVIKTKFDGKITGEMRSMAFYDNAGKYCGAKSVFKDSTKILAIESLERKYESMLEDGINTLDYVIIILDRGFLVKWASTSVAQYFGLDKTAIIGEDMREILKSKVKPLIQHDESFLKNIFSAYETNTCVESFECELVPLGGGENLFLEHWSYPVIQGDLKGGRIEIFRDITARKKSEEMLEYYYKKIHAIMEHAVEGIVELKTDNTVQFVNKSFQDVLGYCDTEMLARSLSDFILPDERMKLASVKLIRKAREVIFVKKDGTLLYTLISSIPLVFGTQPPHALCFISDITETKMASLKLRDANLTLRALNDSLLDVSLRDVRTGVYNFRYLNERLSEEIKRCKRYLRPLSIIMIDIDYFKAINDAYGHSYGDVILKDFTELLKKSVRDTDVVVRSGGEEFVVFLSETDAFGSVTVAQKIIKAVKDNLLGEDKKKVQLSISIGIASYPESGITDVTSLMDASDQAMYQSKQKGRNSITVYSQNNQEPEGQGVLEEKDAKDEGLCGNLRARLRSINSRNEESILESMRPMAREAYLRQGHAHNYCERLYEHVEALAKSFKMKEKECRDARRAALLCNLGFLTLSREVLSKQRKDMAKEEMLFIKEHPQRGLDIIRDVPFLAPVAKAILYHHERYDGRGYPEGIKGGDIPFISRFIFVAETFEALIVPRPYRATAYSKKEALLIIKKESGKQFDPKVVQHFLEYFSGS